MQASLFPCPSQQDTLVYEAYGPHYVTFQQYHVYSCAVLGYWKGC
jgi:hypothetical protein